ncbi:MAG: hypothetical protein ABEN55_23370 [Bradymonadaceae bacterium]
MGYQRHENLEWIDNHFGNRGKYLQVILAASLQKADIEISDIQLVEGFDLEFDFQGQRYGLEVKTTTADEVTLQQKDVDDIEEIREKGMESGFAVLGIAGGSRWWISKPDPVLVEKERTGAKTLTVPLTAFRSTPRMELQEAARAHFDDVLDGAVRMMKQEAYADMNEGGLDALKTELGLG